MMQPEGFRADHACQIAQVSRAGFYRHHAEHEPRQADVEVRDLIQRIVLENRCYGYRRVSAELEHRGVVVNHKRVLRLMRMDNLLAVRKQRFVFTTDSRHTYAVYPHLAARLVLTAVNQLWVADITYVRLRETFLYLAVVIDAFSRKVVGWALATHLQASLALEALALAIQVRKPMPGSLIHHSDRGVQYACDDYTQLLTECEIRPSMSRVGNPYDKAYASHCTSTRPCAPLLSKRRRLSSLTPCSRRGGSGPGSSYSHASLSLAG
jgi:transposase InsO family protein